MPAIAALIYLFVLVRRLHDIVGQLTWNADYVSVMVIAQSIGTSGKSGRAVVVQSGWAWYDLATLHLPYHRQLWEYTPFAISMLSLGLLAWTAWRLAGPFAGVLAASIGIAASPLTLGTQLAQSYHGTTWLGATMLAAYLCLVLTRRMSRVRLIAISIGVALVAGYATATDPLLVAAGDAPFALTLIALWRLHPTEPVVRAGAATAVGTGGVAGAVVLANRLADVGSSFPRGLTHVVTPAHLAGNARQLVSGIFEVAGMPHGGSAFGVLLGLLLVAALVAPMVWLIRSRRDMSAGMVAVTVFWSASTLCVAAAFFFSDIPADFLQNAGRYLISMFYSAAATVPLWASRRLLLGAMVALPAALLIVANAISVDQAAANMQFEPVFGPSLRAPIAFLEQHGLRRGYAAYEDAAPLTWKTDFALQVYPVTEVFVSREDECGEAICPFAYNSISDWYRGNGGPTFILVSPGVARLGQPPPAGLDTVESVYQVDGYVIYVYADDVAPHMGTPPRFKRPLF